MQAAGGVLNPRRKPSRVLKMKLTDGVGKVIATELEPTPCLDVATPRLTKLEVAAGVRPPPPDARADR